ncbi:MAG: sigma-54-dependent Fis family transcriptional regulator [Gammaproteobacteria bacterium]|nr:sigma-54-dependent Fis family transcriptional regulator [Gammaproteobacteria bacterium]
MRLTADNHAKFVYAMVEGKANPDTMINRQIVYSWKRCLVDYGLTPSDNPDPYVLSRAQITERQDRADQLLQLGRVEMANLYQQIAGSGFAVILTDGEGAVLHYVGDPRFSKTAARAGLQVGSIWNEEIQGTNGMGTCLVEQKPLVVHHNEHFLPRNTVLTCSAAPIFDPYHNLVGVLDASSESKLAQQHTVALVNMSAQAIENRLFLSAFTRAHLLRFHSRSEFVSTLGEGIVAFDDSGKVQAANRNALFQLGWQAQPELMIGQNIEQIFDVRVPSLIEKGQSHIFHPAPIRASRDGRRFFAIIQPAEHGSSKFGYCPQMPARAPSVVKPGELTLKELSSGDPRMAENAVRATKILDLDIPIMLYGETGTGKDVFGKALHMSSRRGQKPFVAINCAAIPETLIESELFGYKPGAFTGASRQGSRGKILQANGGTLFLDEIGDMPLNLQARLLRVLEEKEVAPLGGEKTVEVDVHVISATHRDLDRLIASGEFREDLFYRLNGMCLTMPALRDRTDKRTLIVRLLELEFGPGKVEVEEDALHCLESYDWPGNIRQLRNVLRTGVMLCHNNSLSLKDIPDDIRCGGRSAANTANAPGTPLANAERNAILATLEEAHWNVTKAAKKLNVSRNTLYRKMKRYTITPLR